MFFITGDGDAAPSTVSGPEIMVEKISLYSIYEKIMIHTFVTLTLGCRIRGKTNISLKAKPAKQQESNLYSIDAKQTQTNRTI